MALDISSKQTKGTPSPKLHFSSGILPPYISPIQPPTKKSPFREIAQTPYAKSLHLCLNSDLYDQIWTSLDAVPDLLCPIYAKVILSLSEIISGDFFNHYIKTSTILLLSEGLPGVASYRFSLLHGTLRLEMAREIYERSGLPGGQPIMHSGGRKHAKEFWRVDIDLRSPAMVTGKKGFERLKRAAKEVLVDSKVCLFRDLNPKLGRSGNGKQGGEEREEGETTLTTTDEQQNNSHTIIAQHHPRIIETSPVIRNIDTVLVPKPISHGWDIPHTPNVEDLDDFYDINEWLDLVALDSPRIKVGDHPDPHISRYAIPEGFDIGADDLQRRPHRQHQQEQQEQKQGQGRQWTNIKVISWHGFLDSAWITHLLVEIVKQSRNMTVNSRQRQRQRQHQQQHQPPPAPWQNQHDDSSSEEPKSQPWASLSVTSHATDAVGQINGYTILLQQSPAPLSPGPPFPLSVPPTATTTTVEQLRVPSEERADSGEGDKLGVDAQSVRTTANPSAPHGLQQYACFQFVDA